MSYETTTAQSGSSLFSKVSVLLTGMMALGAVGAFAGAGITSSFLLIVLAIVWLLGTIGVAVMCAAAKAKKGDPTGALVAAGVWTFLSGVVSGPALNMYVHTLGAQTVMMAFLGTAGVMSVCGAFGMLSGRNFSRLGGILGIALWGLIIFGLVSIFVSMSPMVNMVYCGIGMAVFAGYFIVDFWRVKEQAGDGNDWPTAILLSMMLYLDFLNFLMYLLRFIKAIQDARK